MSFQQTLSTINPRKLFLIDSLGALLSAVMLGFVLVRFESFIGMPQKELYALSFIACIFFIYSLTCFLSKSGNWKPYMKLIAIANLIYCCLTIGLIFYLYQQLTALGLAYFVGELIIITILALFELKTTSNSVYSVVKKNRLHDY